MSDNILLLVVLLLSIHYCMGFLVSNRWKRIIEGNKAPFARRRVNLTG